MSEVSPAEWEESLENIPGAHILQTRRWGDLKSSFGWKARYLVCAGPKPESSLGAQILFRRARFGFSAAYIAKGPIGFDPTFHEESIDHWNSFIAEIDQICRSERAVFLKVEPDGWEPSAESIRSQPPPGFRLASQTIQPPRTLVVHLKGSEEQVLERMKQKTRYNIRLALKKGVKVLRSNDVETFHHLMTMTGERDVFGVHSRDYYQRAYDLFQLKDSCVILLAEFEDLPLAGLMAFRQGERTWYFYGASSNDHRELMPAYLLQWEAMRWARSHGCSTYDLWGVPDEEEQILEDQFLNRSGDLWGVYRFKRGFGGELRRAPGPWDRVYQPLLYKLYLRWSRWTG